MFLNQHPELLKEPPVISEVNVHEQNNTWFVYVRASKVKTVEVDGLQQFVQFKI